LAVQIFQDLYQLTEAWPRPQVFGLIMDIRRAAMSIPTNLSEGQHHCTGAESQEFVQLAGEQLTALQNYLQAARENPAIDGNALTPVLAALAELGQLLRNLAAPRG